MTQKIGVAIIHGVGQQKPDFAEGIKQELTRRFVDLVKNVSADPASQLVVQPVYWVPVLQNEEDQLWQRLLNGGELDYRGLRKFVVSFAGDAIAYQPAPKERDAYDAVHQVVADSLKQLAANAGASAPLCVVAHSLGTVIASNYFYDLQMDEERKLISAGIRKRMGDTPLERGETFTSLYTFGSPIALWSLRYRDFGKPIAVPSPKLANHYPSLAQKGEWVNFYSKNDVIGYPLKELNAAYHAVVTEDRPVNVGGILTSWNPLSHDEYWTADNVTQPIAEGLARVWRCANKL